MSPARPLALRRTQSVLAWFLAGLVFTLGLLTVDPALHARLHDEPDQAHNDHAAPHSHDDQGCAVTLFQHGVTTPLDLPCIDTPRTPWIATLTPVRETRAVSAPRHRLRPARGPPCIG